MYIFIYFQFLATAGPFLLPCPLLQCICKLMPWMNFEEASPKQLLSWIDTTMYQYKLKPGRLGRDDASNMGWWERVGRWVNKVKSRGRVVKVTSSTCP